MPACSSVIHIVRQDYLTIYDKEDDDNHQQVLSIYEKLKNEDARVIYPISAIVEAATALSRRYGLPELAKALLEKYQNPEIELVDVKQLEFFNSVQYFNPKASKQNTPFDSLILSIAKSQKADVILSFDEFFKNKQSLLLRNKGIKTAWDLVKEVTI